MPTIDIGINVVGVWVAVNLQPNIESSERDNRQQPNVFSQLKKAFRKNLVVFRILSQ